MKTIEQNILEIDHGIICHQVNCQGVMGAGLAESIAKKWPRTKRDYVEALETGKLVLGGIWFSMINTTLLIAHIAGQDQYGRQKQHTDYGAVREGIRGLRRVIDGHALYSGLPIYFPHGFGCGLGGGDWNTMFKIIEEEIPRAIICKLR